MPQIAGKNVSCGWAIVGKTGSGIMGTDPDIAGRLIANRVSEAVDYTCSFVIIERLYANFM